MSRIKVGLYVIFICIFTMFLSFNVHAKEISISNLEVNSTLLKDGSLNIEEIINFKMQGEYNGVYRDIDTKFSDGVYNIQVKEVGASGELSLKQVEKGSDGQNGVYEISKSGQIYKLKIYAPAKNENKKFKICYQLKNVAKKYNDIGELQYRFWGDASETSIDNFNINLSLDNKGQDNTIKVFAKGASRNIEALIVDSNNFNIKGGSVEKKIPIEGRFLFKKEAIGLSNNIVNENGLDKIVQQEKSYEKAIEDERQRKESLKNTGNIVGLGALVLNLILGVIIFKANRKKVEDFDSDFFPEECTPAVASKFYRNSIDEKCLLSTILDLVRKKYLYIEKLSNDDYVIVSNKKEYKELLSHESFIIKWFVSYVGDGLKVKLEEIQDYSKNNKNEFFDTFICWKNFVKEEFNTKGYYNKKSKKLSKILLIISTVETGTMMVFLCNGSIIALVGLLTGISVMIYSYSLWNKKSIYGETQFRKWRRFKKYLEKNNSIKEDLNFIDNIDKYLVYAVALGINNKIFDKFNLNIKNGNNIYNSEDSYYDSCLYWYYTLDMNKEDNIIQQSVHSGSGYSGDSGSSYSGDSGGCSGGGDAGGF